MLGYVILSDGKRVAATLSREIYVEDAERRGIQIEPPPTNMFAVCENILSGEFGLHVPHDYWGALPSKFKTRQVHMSPLWVNQQFIDAEEGPRLFVGSTPFGFGAGILDPSVTRKILEGNFASPLIAEVRNSTRKYTVAVQERAERFIREASRDAAERERMLGGVDPFLFEEIVAELMSSRGFDVFLTSRTRDKGKDLYAAWPGSEGPIVMMVECKRRPPNSALDAVSVRALLGQFTFERERGSRVTCAMLATTAKRVGTVGRDFSEKVMELSIKGYEDLSSWISTYGTSKNNLWLPAQFKDVI